MELPLNWIDLLIIGITFLASFVQSLSGFGFALIAMPLLQPLIGISSTSSLVALVFLITAISLMLYYRQSLQFKPVVPLALASIVMTPFGIYLSSLVNDSLFKGGMGLLLIVYGSYSLLTPTLPQISSPIWGYFAGAFSGLLSGLANVGGPPLIMYGHCQKWAPDIFKSNLQSLFVINIAIAIISRFWQGSITIPVIRWFGICLPALALGVLSGILASRLIDSDQFKQLVLILLFIGGVVLVGSAISFQGLYE